MKKHTLHKLKLILTSTLAAVLLVCPVSAANASSYAGVVATSGGNLNVRSAASSSSGIITKLENGSQVTVAGYQSGWYLVEYAEDAYGWVSGSYLKSAGGHAAYADISYGSLNVRSGASTSYSKVGSLDKGEYFVQLGVSGGWTKILYDGNKLGWVSSEYVSEGGVKAPQYKSISLSVPDYKQYDSRWAYRSLGNTPYTVKGSGCTLCCFSMTESYRLSSVYTPLSALSGCSFTSGGALIWPSNYERWYGSDYLSMLYTKLSQGRPVMIEVKNYYGRTHWAVVTGYSGGSTLSASGFTINDPGSDERDTLGELLAAYPTYSKLTWYN